MRSKNKLTIFHDDNSSFSDHSNDSFDYSRDSYLLQLKTTSYLYVGYYKPINVFYVEMKTVNTNSNNFTIEYYDSKNSIWKATTGLFDDTRGFTRSGFISWDRNLEYQDSNEINNETLVWIRLKPDAEHDVITEIQGINIVYSDDNDLITEFPSITDERYLATNSITHINYHVAARNEIIQRLRNNGHLKIKPTETYVYSQQKSSFGYLPENISPWDVLDMGEIRHASMFLTLSKIFYSLSDKESDYFEQKGKYYYNHFQDMFKTVALSIDRNDDGFIDDKERVATNMTFMTR